MAREEEEVSQIIVKYKGIEAEIAPLIPGTSVIIGFDEDGRLEVQSISDQESHISQVISRGRQRLRNKASILSPREKEVLAEIADDLSNKEIAEKLVITDHTIKTHVKKILTKLGVKSRAAAIGVAYDRGILIRPEEVN